MMIAADKNSEKCQTYYIFKLGKRTVCSEIDASHVIALETFRTEIKMT